MLTWQKQLGDVLSDGTRIEDLFDLDNREASLRLLSDPEIYDLELQLLFAKTWNIVGHVSEIPEPGDYVLRYIGVDSVVVVRGINGDVRVMLNVCTHRGMQVCRAEAGNATAFRCPYHGWAFSSDGGRLIGAPFEKEMYGDNILDKPALGLQCARVEVYAGIIFANWDYEAPPLDDYLGDYKWYLDMIFHRTDEGQEVIGGGPQRVNIRANWKTAGEQFNADNYHAFTLHASLFEQLELDRASGKAVRGRPVPRSSAEKATDLDLLGFAVSSPHGHGQLIPARRRESLNGGTTSLLERISEAPPAGLPRELLPQLPNNLNQSQLRMMAKYGNWSTAGGLFPNVVFLFIGPDSGSGLSLRTCVPRGVGSFELWSWSLVERGASAEYKELARKSVLNAFGSAGIIEQDDAEAWPSMQLSATGAIGRRHSMKYQALRGHNPPEDWEGPCHVHTGSPARDDSQWRWWLRYREYMLGEA